MIRTVKMGTGTLTLTPVGGGAMRDETAQVTAMRVEWDESVDVEEEVVVLSGEKLPREETATYSAKLVGDVLQDASLAGLVAWTWEHRGESVNFDFRPRNAEGTQVTGQVRVSPLTLGGDMNKRNTAPLSWSCTTDPAIGASA